MLLLAVMEIGILLLLRSKLTVFSFLIFSISFFFSCWFIDFFFFPIFNIFGVCGKLKNTTKKMRKKNVIRGLCIIKENYFKRKKCDNNYGG